MVNARKPKHITILGGGPAGLSVGYYAHKRALPFTIYEARERVGGNSITIRHGHFLFDSGPHLLQTKDVEMTNEILELLPGDFQKLVLPVQTYSDGKLVDFPFSPLNLLKTLGIRFLARTVLEITQKKFGKSKARNFEELATSMYGKSMAQHFVLNYSEKLWGRPCSQLSTRITGQQLRGMTLATFLIEIFRGRNVKIRRLGGTIYYPKYGFGTIPERLATLCESRNIRTKSRITSVIHELDQIRSIELNGRMIETTDQVVSTIPINLLIQLLRPKPPEPILAVAEKIQFRALILVVVFLRKPSATESISIHFPEFRIPFTRIHEPKKRSTHMAPDDQTSLVAEIPCQENDVTWNMPDATLIARVAKGLQEVKLMTPDELIDAIVVRLDNAYPVLDAEYEQKIQQLTAYLKKFSNLKITGRTGGFAYLSLHHIMKNAKKTISDYVAHESDNLA